MADFDWESVRASSRETSEALSGAARAQTLAPGELLLTSGALAESVWFVSEGIVRIYQGRPGEPQFTTKILRAPLALGIPEVLNRSSFVGSVEALKPVNALQVPAEAFRTAMERDPAFAQVVLADVVAKYEGTMRLIGSLGFDDAEVRLCRILLEYARHFGRPTMDGLEIRFPLPRERLAREVGTARRTVDRALRSLRELELCWPNPRGWQVLKSLEALQAHIDAKTARNAAGAGR